MEVGDIYYEILCESYRENRGRIRVRTFPCPAIPYSMYVECCKKTRERYPVGTKFITTYVKICRKPVGNLYAHAEGQMIYPLED